jgi:hypothetical protein
VNQTGLEMSQTGWALAESVSELAACDSNWGGLRVWAGLSGL